MRFKRGSTSLSVDFLLFSGILIASVILVPISFWLEIYQEELKKKRERLVTDSERVEALFSDSIDYVSHYVAFIGERISQQQSQNLQYIAQLIGCKTETANQNLSVITTFDWVTPDKQLRVSSCQGVLRKPFDMSDRDYLQVTPEQPWALQLSKPRYGGLSKEWIIPAGMGITNNQKRFLGTITMGFSLEALGRRISRLIGPNDIRYLIFTPNHELILDSGSNNSMPQQQFAQIFAPLPTFESTQYLQNPIIYDGVEFTYQRRLASHPYIILAGYRADMPAVLFNQIVLSRIAGLLLVSIAALVLLYIMRLRFVRPVLSLAEQANQIGKGQTVSITKSNIAEIDVLASQVQRISDYLQNEHHVNSVLSKQTELLKHKTEALEKANVEALEARDAALKADKAKTEFLANMSHEIRTPMNAIIGLTDIMLMYAHAPEKQKEFLSTIQMSAKQLLQLINDLLDLAKLETYQVELEQVPLNMEELLEEIIAINKVTAEKKHIQLTYNTRTGPPEVVGDPLRIRQVLMNLISNAIKFTDMGSVKVELDCQIVPVNKAAHLTVVIADTGIGIPEGKLGLIFGKFSQADNSITRRYGGSGLGLSICKTLMERMGGKISVQSIYGQGSRFTVEWNLPIACSYPGPAVDKKAAIASPPVKRDRLLRGLNVLLVEDNSANILVASTILDDLACNYQVVTSGKEALHSLGTTVFDVVLMDVQMPEMDGFQVTQRLREIEQSRGGTPALVIGLTAHALPGDKQRCLDVGMDHYLGKPFDPEALVQLLRQSYEQKQVRITQPALRA